MKIIISCEHGGNEIPQAYYNLFEQAKDRLSSHEGWDIGALNLAHSFAEELKCEFFYSETSRLLVELNRSLHNPKLFSDITDKLDRVEKNIILQEYYFPYRNIVIEFIEKCIKNDFQVLHISVHSFTPIFGNIERRAAVGLLYDSKRMQEKELCVKWRNKIYSISKDFKIRYNYPYLGKSDGFVTFLRKQFSPTKYIGIELEVNQKIMQDKPAYMSLSQLLVCSLKEILIQY